jgi:holin-like protein
MPIRSQRLPAGLRALLRIGGQSAALAALWMLCDAAVRRFDWPVPSGVLGLAVLLALLFCGGVAPRWIKAGADWLLADLLLFFVPAAVAVVRYGGLLRAVGWQVAVVVVVGTLLVMVTTALAVDQAVRLERRFQRGRAARLAVARS